MRGWRRGENGGLGGVRGMARRLRRPFSPECVEVTEGGPVRGGGTGRRAGGLDERGRLRSGRLAGLGMWQAVWVLAWPVTLESFLNSLVGLTDTKLAAGLGVAETDAIGGASYIMWFIGLVFMALGVGGTALIARSVGRGRIGVANAVLGQATTLAVLAGIVVGSFVAVAAPVVTWLLNMTPEAGGAFESYMMVISAGVPSASLLFVLAACARGAGDAKRPLIAMTVRNVVNIITSYALSGYDVTRAGEGGVREVVLANPFPEWMDLGVRGIAVGTVVGDVVAAGVILWMALGGSWGIRLKARWLRPHWHTVRRLVRLGLPNFLESLGMWGGNFLVMVMVGWLGAAAIARGGAGGQLGTHIIAVRIESFSFLPGFALGTAAATLAGQYLGAGSVTLARRAVIRCAMFASVVMGLLGMAFVLAPRWIVSLLSDQPEHLETTPSLLMICGVVQVPFAVMIVVRGALRGAGDVKVVMVLSWVATYGLRLPLVYFLSGVDIPLGGGEFLENPSPLDWGLTGLWVALCSELTARCVIFTARFAQGGWVRARV